MKKKFIITESERKQIQKMYGLLNEGREEIKEVENYSLEYINKEGCDGIATDIENLSKAVNSGQVNLSPSGKASLEENKDKVKMIGGLTCGIAKNKMKESLNENLSDESQYPDMIVTACWMSKNSVRYTKNLTICSSPTPKPSSQEKPNVNLPVKTDQSINVVPPSQQQSSSSRFGSLNTGASQPSVNRRFNF